MSNKESNFVSAVVYVRNGEDCIKYFLKTVSECLKENFKNSEIICVNDSSSDNSEKIIKEYAKECEGVSVSILNMSKEYGLELAMSAGVDLSIGDFVYEFDSPVIDFDSKVIMDVYRKSLEGFDIVSASSDRKQKFTSTLYYNAFNRFSDNEVKLKTESFRILSRRAINRVRIISKISAYRKASYNLCGLNAANIVYKHTNTDRKSGSTNSYRMGLAVDSLIIFTNFGYKVSLGMVGMMLLLTIAVGFYALIIYLAGRPVQGWTTTILFLSLLFFGLFALLAIIIKYLQIILKLNIQKTPYNIRSIEKLSE